MIEETDMLIGTLVAWYGNKRSLAPTIVEELGPHSGYWEVFCGGLAVTLAKPEASHEHVNDLHADLINLARVIRDREWGAWLYRKLRRTLCHESLFRESREVIKGQWTVPAEDVQTVDSAAAERAYRYMLISWIGRNGVGGTEIPNLTFVKRWTTGGGHGGKRLDSVVSSLPAFRRRMRRLTILRMDAFELLEKIEDEDCTSIYVDPPYFKKSDKYLHDFSETDHGRLAHALNRFKRARVVLSYYPDPRIAAMYPNWTARELVINCRSSLGSHRGGKPRKVTELLLLNGPSHARTDGLFPLATNN